MPYSANELERMLNSAGHLHLHLDSGAEAAVSRHDTRFEKGDVVVESREGDWRFPAEKVELADKEPSVVHPA